VTFRDDLQPDVDDARGIIDEFGLRPFTVVVRTRTWDGGRPGIRNSTDVDLTLSPVPRVRDPSPRLVFAAPGKYEDGDRIVDRISRSYTLEQLTGGALAAGQEVFWLIDGEPYRVVEVPLERNFEWMVHLRRMNR